MNLRGCIDRIEEILRANTSPQFLDVIVGEPLGLPLGGPYAVFWYLGDGMPSEGRGTFTQRFHEERFRVQVYWHRRPELASLKEWEYEITDCKQALLTAFAADSQLGGNCDDLDYSTVENGYVKHEVDSIQWYRVLRFDLVLNGLNEEAISA